MNYNYESLSSDDFQLFVQALLLRDYPTLQCFPIGLPDAGRDGVIFHESGSNEFTVLQVKFVRTPPRSSKEAFSRLKSAILGEALKIPWLKQRGATKYIFVTNISATSHSEVGLIDRVQDLLDQHIDIPAVCYWRNDLDQRLENNFDLKLRYPKLLDGLDAVRLMWNVCGPHEDRERRVDALKAYLRHEYDLDSKVRFKQVELLTSSLFRLFIDVPVQLSHQIASPSDLIPTEPDHLTYVYESAALRISEARRAARDPRYGAASVMSRRTFPYTGSSNIREFPAADLFTDRDFAGSISRIVLEGAPGQGKSTLVQYLAQLQRCRLLERFDDLGLVPDHHASGALALPLKIELRDFAVWMNGFNPWSRDKTVRHTAERSLESALAAHISRYSGGVEFTVSDLHKVIKSLPTFIALDALDEVADLQDRQQVVDEVQVAVARLQEIQPCLSVIITSRPTAISGAPAFSSEDYAYFSLAAIEPPLAIDYTRRWSAARNLDSRDTDDVTRILGDRLTSSHIAELAKNTMQLTILLSLILTRGESLPDKRTELYNEYLDLFLSREAEKSLVVRNNRDLLLNIHQYLGFYLHARAEGTKSNGRISYDELQEVLRQYLITEGHSQDFVSDLTIGMVERIVALFSRVEGTYEFEVQPLREYFAAKYLYDTAPYSPPGRERRGTKPDRFEGIAPNEYWLNVTRFFAGCFSKGELLDLAQRVCDLIADVTYLRSTYPRRLAVAILQDWVFTQSPRATTQVVLAVFTDIGIRWLAHQGGNRRGTINGDASGPGWFSLSSEAGGKYASEIAWQKLLSAEPNETALEVATLLTSVSPLAERKKMWLQRLPVYTSAQDFEFWLTVGGRLRVLNQLEGKELQRVLSLEDEGAHTRLSICVRGGSQLDKLPEDQLAQALRMSLSTSSLPNAVDGKQSIASTFTMITGLPIWVRVLLEDVQRDNFPTLLKTSLEQSLASFDTRNEPLRGALQSMRLIDPLLSGADFRRSLTFWRQLVRVLDDNFGRTLRVIEISVLSAAIVSSSERGSGANSLFDDEYSLPDRIRNAKRRAKQSKWWRQQADRIVDEHTAYLWLLTLIIWSTSQTIRETKDVLESQVESLSADTFEVLLNASRVLSPIYHGKNSDNINWPRKEYAQLGLRTQQLLFPRVTFSLRTRSADWPLRFKLSASAASDCLQALVQNGRTTDRHTLDLMVRCHTAGGRLLGFHTRAIRAAQLGLDPKIADEAIRQAWNVPYPVLEEILSQAEASIPRGPHVLSLAERDSWFAD